MSGEETDVKLLFSDYFIVAGKVKAQIKKAEVRVSKLSPAVLAKYLWKN